VTPAARVAAAIEILDRALAGEALERVLTNWARRSRFAGSGDRAAVRDLVFDAMRRRRSLAVLGGAEAGRGLMLGALRREGIDPTTVFTGEGHAPAPLSEAERAHVPRAMTPAEAADCPDWLAQALRASLGAEFDRVMAALQARAPVFLRVNTARIDVAGATGMLAGEGIGVCPVPGVKTALEVTEGARKIQSSVAYRQGLVEVQDADSQAVVLDLPLSAGMRVLDFCAGGGGKTLAMAARARLEILAHDAHPARLRDLPARAERAGIVVPVVGGDEARAAAPFDLVLLDVPCSGSGSWRRSPEAKWRLTPEGLEALTAAQDAILDQAAPLVAAGGWLAYVTCSILSDENRVRIEAFLSRSDRWRLVHERQFLPGPAGDGFYLAILARKDGRDLA
jgi:16S rRNA (cytosine967-C5)-methyltransferase